MPATSAHLLSPDGTARPVSPSSGRRWRLREVETVVGGRILLHDLSPLGNTDELFSTDRKCRYWTLVTTRTVSGQPLNQRASNIVGRPVFGPAVLTPSRMLD
jgi:hypothetical protein